MTEEKEIRCERCGHVWDYKGEKLKYYKQYPQYIQCSVCKKTIRLK